MEFKDLHPAISFIFFAAVISGSAAFSHPAFILISFICSLVYSIVLKRKKACIRVLLSLLLPVIFAFVYALTHSFGVTVISGNIVNGVTLQASVYGLVLGFKAASAALWLFCALCVITADKTVYLLSALSPKLSIYLSVLFRILPRIKAQAKCINTARRSIGMGINDGNILKKCKNAAGIFSALLTWTSEALISNSDSMRSRGSALKGRSAFSVYDFGVRERLVLIFMFLCITLSIMGTMLGQTCFVFSPRLSAPPVTSLSYVFFISQILLCALPLELYIAKKPQR